MAVSKRLRFEILRRDDFRCRYCGLKAEAAELRVDHVIPVALGGSDEPANLVTACEPCNTGKSSVPAGAPLVEGVAADALRWARAMEQVAEIRAAERIKRTEIKFWFGGVWDRWTNWKDEPFPVPDDALRSVIQFLAAGLERDEIEDLIRVAMNSRAPDKWRYFCGCCWRRIRENTDMAADILKAEGDSLNG